MRRIEPREIPQLERLRLDRERRNLIRKRIRQKRNVDFGAIRARYLRRVSVDLPLPTNRVPIQLPRQISLNQNFEETAVLLNEIRHLVLHERQPVFLIFDEVEYVEPAAALVLTAEIYRCRNLCRTRIGHSVHGSYPKEPELFFQLREMGFYQLIEVQDFSRTLPTEAVGDWTRFLPFRSFQRVESEKVRDFHKAVFSDFPSFSGATKRGLQGAIIEAMQNAVDHAYTLEPDFQTMSHRWWLGGAVDTKREELTFILFDQGVGIPRTLPQTLGELFRNLVPRDLLSQDGFMIKQLV